MCEIQHREKHKRYRRNCGIFFCLSAYTEIHREINKKYIKIEKVRYQEENKEIKSKYQINAKKQEKTEVAKKDQTN